MSRMSKLLFIFPYVTTFFVISTIGFTQVWQQLIIIRFHPTLLTDENIEKNLIKSSICPQPTMYVELYNFVIHLRIHIS